MFPLCLHLSFRWHWNTFPMHFNCCYQVVWRSLRVFPISTIGWRESETILKDLEIEPFSWFRLHRAFSKKVFSPEKISVGFQGKLRNSRFSEESVQSESGKTPGLGASEKHVRKCVNDAFGLAWSWEIWANRWCWTVGPQVSPEKWKLVRLFFIFGEAQKTHVSPSLSFWYIFVDCCDVETATSVPRSWEKVSSTTQSLCKDHEDDIFPVDLQFARLC